MSEIIMTPQALNRVNETNIRAFWRNVAPILQKREALFNEYTKKDCVADALLSHNNDYKVYTPIPQYAVDIATGYFIGKPCKYYSRTDTTVEKVDTAVGKKAIFKTTDKPINENYVNAYIAIMRENHEDEVNINTTQNAMICGTAYERIYTVRDGDNKTRIRFKPLNPRSCVLIKDATLEANPIGFISHECITDWETGQRTDTFEFITQNRWDKFVFEDNSLSNRVNMLADAPNAALLKLVGIPVVEYSMPYHMSLFENVLSQIKSRDYLYNNLKNTFKYNDEAIMVLTGFLRPSSKEEERERKASLEEFKTLYLDDTGKVEWLIKKVDIGAIQNFFEDLTNDIYASLGLKNPVRTGEAYQNLSAVRLHNYGLDNKILIFERGYERSLLEGRAKKITALLNALTGEKYNWETLDVNFERNTPSSLIEEAQFASQMAASGVISDADIVDRLTFIENTDAAIRRKQAQDAEAAKTITDIIDNGNLNHKDTLNE